MINFLRYLKELSAQGTYAAMEMEDNSAALLYSWVNAGVVQEALKQPLDYHCTLVYSKLTLPPAVYRLNGSALNAGATPLRLSNFNDNLVLEISCPVATKLNKEFRERFGGAEDFPVYHPHVTLISHLSEWELSGGNWKKLDVYNAPELKFDKIIVTPLDE